MEISVIIPVHNGGDDFHKCLQALSRSSRRPDEVIVVDDASTDATEKTAAEFGSIFFKNRGGIQGPAKSRNYGAQHARGNILIFIDADVLVHPNTIQLIEKYLLDNPQISGLFGSYDDAPVHRNLVSLYKNLLHHFIHQNSRREASTFWTGAGAIRRQVFNQLGGFNEGYSRPSIEDIELGLRLKDLGHQIYLFPELQVTHLKRWNLRSLLLTDIYQRAVPWTKLILERNQMPSDLNLDRKSRFSAIGIWFATICFILGVWFPLAWIAAFLCLGFLVAMNRQLYRFFYKNSGFRFTLGAISLHILYFLYSSLTFGLVWASHLFTQEVIGSWTSRQVKGPGSQRRIGDL
jgi:glycosyltransferase involved in cell wall biosynthesis